MVNGLPTWIETDSPAVVSLGSTAPITEGLTELANACGILAEPLTVVQYYREGPGSIVEPQIQGPSCLSPAVTVTLLAMIRAFFSFPVMTGNGSLIPNGGFAPRRFLCTQIEALTEGSRLLFNPSERDLQTAVRRLKDQMGHALGRRDLVESRHGWGYRLRIWPGLITVLRGRALVTEM